MIVIPKEAPIIENLNSYYVKIERLIEHYQGEIGCGSLYFKSMASEGILFFDKDEILNGVFAHKNEEIKGPNAIKSLVTSSETTNYTLSVHQLRSDDIYFWSTIPDSKRIYQDLSTEFTELEGLIKKMKTEGLIGFIEVSVGDGKGNGLVFFNAGEITGGSYTWGRGDNDRSIEDQNKLVQLTKEFGGSFNVSRIPLEENGKPESVAAEIEAEEVDDGPSERIITAMEEMIAIFERTVSGLKSIDADFATLLSRKFVEKADSYPFLDPFVAEFKYANGKITFEGQTTDKEFTEGILQSLLELAEEIDTSNQSIRSGTAFSTHFKNNLVTWMKKYKKETIQYNIEL
jgi:hypothetical protein